MTEALIMERSARFPGAVAARRTFRPGRVRCPRLCCCRVTRRGGHGG